HPDQVGAGASHRGKNTEVTEKTGRQIPHSADSVRNDGAGEAQKTSQRASRLEWRVGDWSRESETSGPVMRRAPRLKVRYSKPHWMKTRTRLWNSTMYIRWMKSQTSQAGKPEM